MYSAVIFVLSVTVSCSVAQITLSDLFPPKGLCGLSAEEREAVLERIHNAIDIAPGWFLSVALAGGSP